MKAIGLMIILLSIGFNACDKKSTAPETLTIEDLLVKDNEISGWSKTGEFWLAGSSTDLYTYIDGAADLYNIHGFVEAVSQTYEGPIEGITSWITINIFDQGSQDNAEALFLQYIDENMSNPELWQEVGEGARIQRYDLATQIVFKKSKYFIYLEVGSSLEKALDILKSFARNIELKI
ncbi:hypothetical protein JW835_04525 [bacterium]|nr:hypothetical protein [bacterium]